MSKARLRPMQLFNMSGKVCIVTGASSGLGERFVRVLHLLLFIYFWKVGDFH